MKRNLTAIGWLIVAVLPILSGCSQSSSNALAAPSAKGTAKAAAPAKEQESWDIMLLQGKRIGYIQNTIRPAVESGRDVLRIESTARISLRRGNDTSQQTMRVLSVETPEGQMLRYESEIGMGADSIRSTGKVNGNRLEIETTGAAATAAKTSLPWSANTLGPLADQLFVRNPIKPGEHRIQKMLLAEFQQVGDMEATAKDYEPCKLQTGMHDLLRIESVARLADGQKVEQTLWIDRTGNIRKTYVPTAGGMESYRVSKAEALDKADDGEFDLMPSTMVKVDPPPTGGHRRKQVVYRVHLDGSDPASVFVTGPTQAIKSIDANTAEITVYAIRPGENDGNPKAPADPSSDDDSRPNVFVQSDDPLIVADAKKAAGDEKDPWRVAVALERFVEKEVKTKNFSQTFATAAEVAKTREGDCTEHAVLLAALCRARGLPARVAIGLVYMDGSRAFFYHMWTEVYIDKRWIPIDGTLARGGIGAAHLKIAQSSLKDASAYSAFLPVMNVLGRLSIKVIDAK